MGANLAIVGRDRESTETAARELHAAGGEPVEVIDVLINNVGGYWNTRHVTADGLERTLALNHLAAFVLTNLRLADCRTARRPGWSRSLPTPRPGADPLQRPPGGAGLRRR